MSASASPGFRIGDVSHAMYTRGSSTRAVTTLRRSEVIFGVSALIGGTAGPRFSDAEVLLDQRLHLRRLEVADDGEAGVVRRVVLLEESLHVVELRGLDVFVRADDIAVVRMAGREQRLHQRFLGQSVRLVLDALPPFVADHVLLIRQRGLIDLLEQVSHAIGFEPERELDLIDGTVSK